MEWHYHTLIMTNLWRLSISISQSWDFLFSHEYVLVFKLHFPHSTRIKNGQFKVYNNTCSVNNFIFPLAPTLFAHFFGLNCFKGIQNKLRHKPICVQCFMGVSATWGGDSYLNWSKYMTQRVSIINCRLMQLKMRAGKEWLKRIFHKVARIVCYQLSLTHFSLSQ